LTGLCAGQREMVFYTDLRLVKNGSGRNPRRAICVMQGDRKTVALFIAQ
jgi:hypothetical protein